MSTGVDMVGSMSVYGAPGGGFNVSGMTGQLPHGPPGCPAGGGGSAPGPDGTLPLSGGGAEQRTAGCRRIAAVGGRRQTCGRRSGIGGSGRRVQLAGRRRRLVPGVVLRAGGGREIRGRGAAVLAADDRGLTRRPGHGACRAGAVAGRAVSWYCGRAGAKAVCVACQAEQPAPQAARLANRACAIIAWRTFK